MYIKHITLKPAHGGYIICCDKYKKAEGEYDGMRHVGEHKIVVEDSAEAMDIVDQLFAASMEGMEVMDLPTGDGNENKGTNLLEHE